MQSKIKFSDEARRAEKKGGGYASALRRAAKRREALATANPYVVAIAGFCDAYLYCHGVLCYTLDDKIRVLALHRSAQHEVVISIPLLLRKCLVDIEDNARGIFRVFYYSDKIISCIYQSSGPDPTAWLIAFDISKRTIMTVQELESTEKLFVRNNSEFLYYGTHSEIGDDGYKKWVIHGVEFAKKKWFPHKVQLLDMVGSEIGSTICFEFHNNYFYALSNQTSFEVEEIDWTSFYHCVRFPLNSPCKESWEHTENNSMWRRQHQEGPIDDRWTDLRLDEDESTAELRIVESRKEWALGSSRSRRTFYITDIIWPKRSRDEDLDIGYELAAPFSLSSGLDSISASDADSSSSSSGSTSTTSSTSNISGTAISKPEPPASPASKYHHDLSLLPNDPILKLLHPDDNPHHMAPPPRLPQNTHPGNDGSSKPTITLSKCRIRHYHPSSSTFLDLVDDPKPTSWQNTQRLRLRAGSRKRRPPMRYPTSHHTNAGLLRPASEDLEIALEEMYREGPIAFWPPAQDPDAEEGDAEIDALYRLLNPPSHLGGVEGTSDERSLVYVTGAEGSPKAIVFIAFDAGIKLAGLRKWGRKGVGEGPHVDGRATGCGGEVDGNIGKMKREGGYIDVGERDRTVALERKGKDKEKGQEICTSAVQYAGGQATVDVSTQAGREPGAGMKKDCWAWREKAMYRDIGLGYYFGLDRKKI